MTAPPASGLSVIPVAAGADRTAWPERAAALTRAAYAGSDPWPGLPVPDGARDSAWSVRAFLAEGGTLWTARTAHGGLAGVLRTARAPEPDGTWTVSRVAVAPGWRGRGVARLMLAAVEQAAVERVAGRGASVMRLDAVVERCLPPLYARLGYRVVRHWAAEDKPLTELTMERDPATPRRPRSLLEFWDEDAEVSRVVCWFVGPDGLSSWTGQVAETFSILIQDLLAGSAGARLAGVDVWRGDSAGFESVAVHHLMPRTRHPDLWAALRFAPGAEPDLRALTRAARHRVPVEAR